MMVCLSVLLLGACGTQSAKTQPGSAPAEITLHAVPDGEIWFRNSKIQLRFDSEMYCRVYLQQGNKLYSINDIPPDPKKARPPHFLAISGEEVRNFEVDYKNVGASEIRTQFGIGRKLHLNGYAKTSQGVIIEKKVAVELYQDFPDAALVSAAYRNTDPIASIVVTLAPTSFFRMDASRSNAAAPAYDFWISFRGSESQSPTKIDSRYSQSLRRGADGGLLVDLWTNRMGMALGDLSTETRDVTAAVTVTQDQKVELEFHLPGSVQLQPNASISIPKTVWLVHSGDDHTPSERYQELRRRQSGQGV